MKWDATLYDAQHAFVSGYGSSLLELLDPKQGERNVDLGCGTGDLSYEISLRGPACWAWMAPWTWFLRPAGNIRS